MFLGKKEIPNWGRAGFIFITGNEAQERRSLLDTIFEYIFYFGPSGTRV